jgi:serine phosphatase RsbU (regulator of sigma subunit)/tetratricopeptide (TPR) repeat protein
LKRLAYILFFISAFQVRCIYAQTEQLIEYVYKQMDKPVTSELTDKLLDLETAKDTIKTQPELRIKTHQCLFDYYFLKKDFQNAIRNSLALQYFIKTKTPDKTLALSEIYYKTAVLYAGFQNRLKSLEYYQKGITEISKNALNEFWCKSLNGYINTSISLNRISSDLVNYLNDFSTLCVKENDFEALANNYSQLAYALARNNKTKEATEYHRKAEEAYQKSGNKVNAAVALNNVGYLLRKSAKYSDAIEPLNKADNLLKSSRVEWPEVYNNLGVNYAYMNKFFEAEIYFTKALTINKSKGNLKGFAESNNYLALSGMLQNNGKDAREYVTKAIEISERESFKDVLAESYLILSKLEAKESNYKSSQEYDNKYNKIMNELNQMEAEFSKKEQEANYESEKDEKRILNEINEKEKRDLELAQLRLMADKIKKEREAEVKQQILLKEKTEQSLLAARRQIEIQKKIVELAQLEQEKQKQAAAFAEREKETIKKQKNRELRDLAEKNRLEAEARFEKLNLAQSKTKQKIYLIGFVLVGALLLIALYAFIRNFKQKKIIEATNQQLQSSNDEISIQKGIIEVKNEEILDSINYAQKIQTAILPHEAQLREWLPDAMMLYLPKDRVSGDFPWIFKEDDSLYVAAVDCTGHGVPGALLSVIGHFVLNDSVQHKTVTNPAQLLMHMHEGVKHTLKQEQNLETRDGMDIAVCKFHLNMKRVEFAGAHRHLYRLRNGEITEYKGTRRPIGGIKYDDKGPFVNTIVDLQKGDALYFYTDGYPDQTGGTEKKKFMNHQIKTMILEHQHLTMQEQKEKYTDTFNNYKGVHKQIDDVLFVGIRV